MFAIEGQLSVANARALGSVLASMGKLVLIRNA
jgi:hypothetical protein